MRAFFVPLLLSKSNFFKICVLSQSVAHWMNFQNIRIYILLHIKKNITSYNFLFVFKIVKRLQCTLKILRRLNWNQGHSLEEFCKKYTFKNFVNLTVKHLCWSLFLMKLQGWCSVSILKRNSGAGVFLHIFWNFEKIYFVEHVPKDVWVKWSKKIVDNKSIHRQRTVMESFLVKLHSCGFSVVPNGIPW